jgi:hypothetical protein
MSATSYARHLFYRLFQVEIINRFGQVDGYPGFQPGFLPAVGLLVDTMKSKIAQDG